jgi:thiamine biosynthesis protein ThiS
MTSVAINGQTRETEAEDVAALIAELGFTSGTVLVEHNGTALRPAEWSQRPIQDGDRFELLRIAAGG